MTSTQEPFDPFRESRVTEAFVRNLLESEGRERGLISAIHPADEMYRYNVDSLKGSRECAAILYFAKGYQILQTVREIARWRFGGLDKVGSFLDFASGYGRFTRFLVRQLDPDRVWIAEIDPEAVSFQQSVFRVQGWVSGSDPDGWVPERTFDFIFACSFFSHLPKDSFEGWLRRLAGALGPGGILAFSVHGADLLSGPEGIGPESFVFLPESESHVLDKTQYGTTYAGEDFVRQAVARAAGPDARLQCFPRALCAFQDVYILEKPGSSKLKGYPSNFSGGPDGPPNPLGALDLPTHPRGDVDVLQILDDKVLLGGWTVDGVAARSVEEVQLCANNLVLDRCKPRLEPGREGGSGPLGGLRWSFEFSRDRVTLDDVIMIQAVNRSGFRNILGLGSLEPFVSGARMPSSEERR